ncbi:MAG: hypothetical protein UY72_C0057G0004 [Candidatus Uhrbacteria bacterium GW2011_GWD2_52_7]|uniref:Uncharacterized protein n=1 Tax=Candidatus Uhrbacteria bacterium GW2011_GWD2_52_7 TaxID=1618989 RepID=A0A0G1XDI9_9BACT|nr:MAG: hypothetical protein UY72_C0057G0004 [Candidatus Uhrbacteria bacterium GW2011_GWD2_52_7]
MPVPFKDLQPEWQQYITELEAQNALYVDTLAGHTLMWWTMGIVVIGVLLVILLVVKIERMRSEREESLLRIERDYRRLRAMINGFGQLHVHLDTLATSLPDGIVRYNDVVVITSKKLDEDVVNNPSRLLEDIASGWVIAFRIYLLGSSECGARLSAPLTTEEFRHWCAHYTTPPIS